MVVHKIPIKHDDPQIHIIPPQSTDIQRASKPVPLVRQAPVFDLEVITSDNFVPWKNTFNMRQVTLANIIDVANGNDKVSTKASKMRAKNLVNAAKSLDLLRQNLQSSINKEIDDIIRKYLTTYFGMAIDNVKNNLGSNSMTEDHVREVCRTMLDEAKLMYSNPPLSGSNSPFNTAQTTDMLIESRFAKPHSDDRSPLKRKEQELEDNLSPTLEQKSTQPPLAKYQRFHSAWDPSKIHSQTLFVLATRTIKKGGRVCNKHPELFQYTIDLEDRDWLIKQKLFNLPPPSPSNSVSLLLLEDVQYLLNNGNHKNNSHDLRGFELPEFMLNKVRSTMILKKPADIQSPPQQIVVKMENTEIEEQTACSITLNENANPSIRQSSGHSESSSIIISGTSTTLAEALNMLEYGERLPQHNEISHSSSNNNTGLATTHSTLTALLAAENNFMPNSGNGIQSRNNVTQFGM